MWHAHWTRFLQWPAGHVLEFPRPDLDQPRSSGPRFTDPGFTCFIRPKPKNNAYSPIQTITILSVSPKQTDGLLFDPSLDRFQRRR